MVVYWWWRGTSREVPLATLSEGKQLSADQSGAFFLSITNAVALCVEAVDLLFRTAGGPAIYATGPLDRAFRDIHSAAQHPLVSLRGYEIAGRALLGAYYWNTFSRLGGESSALVEIIAKADPMVFCCVARRVICQCPDKIALIAEQIVHP